MDVLPFFLSGIIIGSIYGLTTLGLSLIFGVLRVANVAHGSFIMIGAYTAFFAFTLWGIVPFLSAALGFGLGALMGYLVYLGVIKPLRKMGELHTLVALFALGMFIAEVARVLLLSRRPRGRLRQGPGRSFCARSGLGNRLYVEEDLPGPRR